MSKLEKKTIGSLAAEEIESVKRYIAYLSRISIEKINILGYDAKKRVYNCEIDGVRGEIEPLIVQYM